MATKSIDINYLISNDTEMDYFNNEISLIDKKSDLTKIEKALSSIDVLGLHREDAKIIRTKLGNIKRKIANLAKRTSSNPLAPIMVKIKDIPKPPLQVNRTKPTPPKIEQSSFDFNSKVKKVRKSRSKSSKVMSQSEIDQEIARMQKLGDGVASALELTTESIETVVKKVAPIVKRVTKMQKALLVVRQLEASNKTKHNEILENKHKIDKNYNNRKLRNDENDSRRKFEGQQLAKESRENIENTKLKRLELSTNAKAELAKATMDDKVRIHKIDADAKIKVANTHAMNRLNLAESNTKNKIALVKANTESKLRIQQQRSGQVNRSQMQRDLHGVHPALGALYGYSQNAKDKDGNNDGESSGGLSGLLAGGAGGVGALGASKVLGKSLGKGLAKKIPILGSIVTGLAEYQKSGDVGKSGASSLGSLVGGAATGALAGLATGGPIGAIVGAIVGSYLGETVAKQLYNKFFGNSDTSSSSSSQYDPNGKSSSDSSGSPQSSSGLIRKYTDADGMTESRTGGTKSWRNKNAGNIRYGAYAKSKGAIGQDSDGFAMFASEDDGEKAREDLIFNSKSYKDLSVDSMISKYAPPSENNTKQYQSIARTATGTSGNTKLSMLNPAQRKALLSAMKSHEGYKAGSINYTKEKAPSMVKGVQDADDNIQQSKNVAKSQPMNVVISNGGSTGGSTVVNNISHHAPNTDSTVRQLNNNNMNTASGM